MRPKRVINPKYYYCIYSHKCERWDFNKYPTPCYSGIDWWWEEIENEHECLYFKKNIRFVDGLKMLLIERIENESYL